MTAMTFGEMRTRGIERMAEYHAGAAEVSTASSINGQTWYNRMASVMRDMHGLIQRRDPSKLITTANVTYPASTESVSLSVALTNRPIHTVERRVNTSTPANYDPLRELDLEQMENALKYGELPQLDEDAPWSNYGYYIEGGVTMYVVPVPASALTLRVRYTAGLVTPTDGADDASNPVFIPEEHHELIALETALRFLRETGNNARALEDEKRESWAAFVEWATSSPKTGTRSVRHV